MAEKLRPRSREAPAESPSRQAPDKSKSTSGHRRIARTAGEPYGRAALESALEDIAEATERSRGLYRNACAMGNLISGGQLEERFVVIALTDAADGRGMNRRHAERTIERGIKRGKETPRTPSRPRLYNRNDATVALVEWWEAVGRADWTERSSATDLRVLAGFGLIAKRVGKVRFTASHRQIAEESGVSVSSVRIAIRRGLQGYVHKVRCGNRIQGTASKWQLVTKRARTTHSLSLGEEPRLGSSCARAIDLPDHDLWHRWPQGWRVYGLLGDEGMTASEISETMEKPAGSIRRILVRLRDLQLARRDDDGGWTALPPPEGVVDGGFRRARKERRHRDERQLWSQSRAVLIEKNWAAR